MVRVAGFREGKWQDLALGMPEQPLGAWRGLRIGVWYSQAGAVGAGVSYFLA